MQKKLKILFAFLLLGLALSMGINFLFYHYGYGFYLQLNQVRLDPLGYDVIFTNENNMKNDEKMIVFYGDSRAADWFFPVVDGYFFLNRGIGGQTSEQVKLRYEEHVAPLTPDIVVLQVGINDLKTISIFPGDKEKIMTDVKSNIQSIVERSNHDNSKIILTTIFPTADVPLERQLFWDQHVNQAVEEVNTYIFSLESDQVIIFDSYSLLVNEHGFAHSEYVADFLHINQAGYSILNNGLINLLSSEHNEIKN